MSTDYNGHFLNLPKQGTVVTLLDRKSNAIKYALVMSRVKRNGKLRLAFLGSNGKMNYTVAVPNGSSWAADKTVRFRWSYSSITNPPYPEELLTAPTKTEKYSLSKSKTPGSVSERFSTSIPNGTSSHKAQA